MENFTKEQLELYTTIQFKSGCLHKVIRKMISMLNNKQIKEIKELLDNEPNKLPTNLFGYPMERQTNN